MKESSGPSRFTPPDRPADARASAAQFGAAAAKKDYRRPRLELLGSLRALTAASV